MYIDAAVVVVVGVGVADVADVTAAVAIGDYRRLLNK